MEQLATPSRFAALSVLGLSSQGGRLLRMDFPRGDGPANTVMLVNTLTAREEISRDFQFDVEVLSDDAHIPLTAMMARMVTISLLRNDGTLRYFNGYVSEFRFVRADGGFAFYRMRLAPWLTFTRLRQNCASFLNLSVIELTETVFANYDQHAWNTSLEREYPQVSCANQYNETDYNHLHRRWEAHGLHYWYEHQADGHTLWLGDDSSLCPSIDAAGGMMVFRSESGAREGDGVREWQAVRRLGPGSSVLSSFDYKQPTPRHISAYSRNHQDAVAEFEWAEYAGAYGYHDADDGALLSQRRMDERDANLQYFDGAGNDRSAQAGRVFRLDGHFSGAAQAPAVDGDEHADVAGREFLLLRVEHSASNNYQAGAQGLSHYDNHFTCVSKDVRWRPGRQHNSTATSFTGVQTAIVTGPSGTELYTDDLNRIKLQFHWDRRGQYDHNSSPWIRVMMPLAGWHLGQSGLPRVGQEVVVQFLEGNLDRPIVIGVVHNAVNPPPWDLPSQQALTGVRSAELGANQRGNHLLLDDTAGEIQAQLRSDHQHSQLALGHITRVEDHSGRRDARGQGWELRTDGHGVLRAAQGMLITSEARPGAAGPAKAMAETVARLQAASAVQRASANQAGQHKAQEGAGQQSAVAAVLQQQCSELQGSGGNFPELAAAHVVLASPAGIETSSAQSTHIASEVHTALTTGGSVSIAAGDSLFASIAQTLRLFVHKAGMKLIAAAGKATLQAQTDDVDVIANKVLRLISEADWVDIRGRQGVRLHGNNCMIEISDKVQFYTSSPTLFHGNLETLAPKNRPQPAPEPASAPTDGELHQTLRAHVGGKCYANVPYTLYRGETKLEDGITDEHGRIVIAHQDGTPEYQVVLAPGERFVLTVSPRFADGGRDGHDEQQLSNAGWRALDSATTGRRYH
ncbi:type VI secretion system Vgr family protein [Duganella callida]|uniref:Type VI secretion system tip protein VgrG n=1 Tax=Duganella callida TaxID=2561932 RepID=A0A4Y9T057_9BURK|nr:type VI secretion system Vgr family protein [Duganella callida]TFW30376.1 type VI secretion system tip protein VgrG [Duganella callida]